MSSADLNKKNKNKDNNSKDLNKENKKTEKDKRAERLKEELQRVTGTNVSAEKLLKLLDGIIKNVGTARSYIYQGNKPSSKTSVAIAQRLNIDHSYWLYGLRPKTDSRRLATSIALIEKVMDRRDEDFTPLEVAEMIAIAYDSRVPICETVIERAMDIFRINN